MTRAQRIVWMLGVLLALPCLASAQQTTLSDAELVRQGLAAHPPNARSTNARLAYVWLDLPELPHSR